MLRLRTFSNKLFLVYHTEDKTWKQIPQEPTCLTRVCVLPKIQRLALNDLINYHLLSFYLNIWLPLFRLVFLQCLYILSKG